MTVNIEFEENLFVVKNKFQTAIFVCECSEADCNAKLHLDKNLNIVKVVRGHKHPPTLSKKEHYILIPVPHLKDIKACRNTLLQRRKRKTPGSESDDNKRRKTELTSASTEIGISTH